MQQAYVHAARIQLAPDSDEAAPGGAVTVALCGGWQHDGPCRWPHHTSVERVDGAIEVRTVVVSDAADEPGVRERIDDALESGTQEGPDGRVSIWILLSSGPDDLRADEQELARRIHSAG